MNERVKIFTYSSGTGSTLIEPSLEDHINEWLKTVNGKLLMVTQSESERQGMAHITVCIWYLRGGSNVQS
jgi:hypothetical protein